MCYQAYVNLSITGQCRPVVTIITYYTRELWVSSQEAWALYRAEQKYPVEWVRGLELSHFIFGTLRPATVLRPVVWHGGSVCVCTRNVHTDSSSSGWMRMTVHPLSEIIIRNATRSINPVVSSPVRKRCPQKTVTLPIYPFTLRVTEKRYNISGSASAPDDTP